MFLEKKKKKKNEKEREKERKGRNKIVKTRLYKERREEEEKKITILRCLCIALDFNRTRILFPPYKSKSMEMASCIALFRDTLCMLLSSFVSRSQLFSFLLFFFLPFSSPSDTLFCAANKLKRKKRKKERKRDEQKAVQRAIERGRR